MLLQVSARVADDMGMANNDHHNDNDNDNDNDDFDLLAALAADPWADTDAQSLADYWADRDAADD